MQKLSVIVHLELLPAHPWLPLDKHDMSRVYMPTLCVHLHDNKRPCTLFWIVGRQLHRLGRGTRGTPPKSYIVSIVGAVQGCLGLLVL